MFLTIPGQQEAARETSIPIPKELGQPFLEGGMLGS